MTNFLAVIKNIIPFKVRSNGFVAIENQAKLVALCIDFPQRFDADNIIIDIFSQSNATTALESFMFTWKHSSREERPVLCTAPA